MINVPLEIILIGSIMAISCVLVGNFLVLKKMSMMSDAITHTVLLGIVIGFLITHDLNSPLLYVGAIIVGLLTTYLVEYLISTQLVSQEAAIGVVFPFLFSIAIVLINLMAGSVHLDTDAVLLGELAFAPLDRTMIGTLSVPTSLITGIIVLVLDALIIKLFFKELTITSFDSILAMTLGISPIIVNYLLMTLVSLTAVNAFNSVGSILVISFMIGPPTAAYLLTNDLKKMIFISIIISIINVSVGYYVARILDLSVAGSMAFITGISFILVFLFSPQEGYIMRKLRFNKQKKDLDEMIILYNIDRHNIREIENLSQYLRWSPLKIKDVVNSLQAKGYLEGIQLSTKGKERVNMFDKEVLHI